MKKKATMFTFWKLITLILLIAIIVLILTFIKNIDIIKEGIDKFLKNIASFK